MPLIADRSQGKARIPLGYTIEPPDYQERVFFLGANGSGKTVLASELLTTYPRVFVLDVKYDFPIPWPKGKYRIADAPSGQGFWNTLAWKFGSKRVIYRPKPPFDSGDEITRWLDWLFDLARKQNMKRRDGDKRPFILYLDEGAWTAYAGAKTAMARLAIAGRSIGIGLWIASQRPRGIPVEVRSEAWRYYVFFLKNRDDRKEICNYLDDVITEQDLAETTQSYQFLEIKRGQGGQQNFRLMPPIRLTKGSS